MKNLSKKEIKKTKPINLFPDPKLPPTQQDFRETFQWRIFRIMAEFVDGFQELSDIGDAVTVFGSARTHPQDKYYKIAEDTSRLLAKNGYAVITGAGYGIMEAANKGAKKADGVSIGFAEFEISE